MMARKIQSNDSDQAIREAFRVFNRNQSGRISGDELRFVLLNINSQLTPDEVDQLIHDADSDHDGQISYEGFL